MPMTDIAALVLGVVIALVIAAIAGEVTGSTDDRPVCRTGRAPHRR